MVYYTTEYYSAVKKSKMMELPSKRRDLEIIILSKVTKTQKDKY